MNAVLVLLALAQSGFEVKEREGGVDVTVGGKPFATYVLDQANKTYLYPVYGPTGKQMTRAYPMKDVEGERKDHPHHRGINFGHQGINGVDTWLEALTYGNKKKDAKVKARLAAMGRIKHLKFTKLEGGKDHAIIAELLEYQDGSGKRFMTEERTITFRVVGETRTIDWDQDLVASEGDLSFADKKDAGLSIRVRTSMDVDSKKGGVIVNSEGDRDKGAWSKKARWCDYNGPVEGEHLGVAILNHPSSFRHPTAWHVRTYGLFTANAFASKEFNKKNPDAGFTLKKGDRVKLRHRFILHKGNEKQAKIEEAYKAYAKEK
jgi:hypothetical protein